jgi:hypothetical protein
VDPSNGWTQGIFFVEKDELSTCFIEYSIAHERSSDGYFPSWIDVDGVAEGQAAITYTFTVEE